MKKLISILLAAVMACSMVTAFAAGLNFTDVAENDWYYNDVKSAVELGLVNGKSETAYAPQDNLTYAEAIKLAACMNQLYVEKAVTLAPGTPWYQTFVDYCKEKGITTKDYNYTDYATREGYMEIFANALPAEGLAETNYIPDGAIPDVPATSEYAAGVYKLYRAGILTGVDAAHNCNPKANITRAEVAAILTRMMNADKRVKFDMGEKPAEKPVVVDGLTVVKQPKDVETNVGVIAEFTVEVAGNKGMCDYIWQYESNGKWMDFINTGTTIMSADTDALKLYCQEAMEMNIRCKVSDSQDQTFSEAVKIIVKDWE